MRNETHSDGSPANPKAGPKATPVVDVQLLLDGQDEARLMHRGVEYRLRVTRQGKLILTK